MADMYPQPPNYESMDFHVLHVCTSPRVRRALRFFQSVLRLDRGYPFNQPLRGCSSSQYPYLTVNMATMVHNTLRGHISYGADVMSRYDKVHD